MARGRARAPVTPVGAPRFPRPQRPRRGALSVESRAPQAAPSGGRALLDAARAVPASEKAHYAFDPASQRLLRRDSTRQWSALLGSPRAGTPATMGRPVDV